MAELDLRPKNLTVLLRQNDQWSAKVTMTNPDGTPFDLTGYTITGPFKTRGGAAGTAIVISGIVAASGIFYIGQAAATAGTFDIILTNGANIRTYIDGTIGTEAR